MDTQRGLDFLLHARSHVSRWRLAGWVRICDTYLHSPKRAVMATIVSNGGPMGEVAGWLAGRIEYCPLVIRACGSGQRVAVQPT